MSAALYIYRNLRTSGFSVRRRGKVIAHEDSLLVTGAELQVSASGNARARREKQRNVHAYIVTHLAERCAPRSLVNLPRITYNPHRDTSFMCNGKPIFRASSILLTNGQAYLLK